MSNHLTNDIISYWTHRAESYGELNRNELAGAKADDWLRALTECFPGGNKEDLQILDIGTGPGFFPILLARNGYRVHAVDLTEEMLAQARANAGELADRIRFARMNADALDYEDASFDVIINRNLTWNLEDPCVCYREWYRVLRPGGRLIIFDANWYKYLYDEEARRIYEETRANVASKHLKDFNLGDRFEVMEEIAKSLPMSRKSRPAWDMDKLSEIGFIDIRIDEDVWLGIWTEEEKINYTGTPMFRICAAKA